MGKYWILALIFLLPVGILFAQDNPSVQRISQFKVITGEGRLRSSLLLVKLRQDQRFTNSEAYFVSVMVIDSSTGTGADSIRAFAIKNLSNNQFTIRSVQRGDTCRVRWMAIGR